MVDGAPKAGPESRFGGLAAGLSSFAGVLLLVVGVFQALEGLSAIVRDRLLVVTPDYIYRFDISAWGWIHLVIGLALVAVGIAILAGKTWGRVVGIAIATVSAITQFLWLPYFPVWAILVIALDVGVIWA
ncbi:MAG TPA: hypothetical protein VKP64_11820, partial [Mycobacteriales bacterium]|nr:hypothetical protein [Mycobacteriales bacterium]